jgi:hypothetical protein
MVGSLATTPILLVSAFEVAILPNAKYLPKEDRTIRIKIPHRTVEITRHPNFSDLFHAGITSTEPTSITLVASVRKSLFFVVSHFIPVIVNQLIRFSDCRETFDVAIGLMLCNINYTLKSNQAQVGNSKAVYPNNDFIAQP